MMVVNQIVSCIRMILAVIVWIHLAVNVIAFDGRLQFYPRGDHYLIVGSELRANCSLEENGTDFDLNKVNIKKGTEDQHNVTFTRHVEDNALEMIISNVSISDSGTYLCYYGNETNYKSFTVVKVAETPGRPENITCWSDRLTDMNCSFSLSKSTNLPMKWRMEYRRNRRPPYHVNCSQVTEYEVHCDTVPPKKFSTFSTYEVWVEGVNEKYKVNLSKSFEIYTNYSLARFGPVQELTVTGRTNVAILQWNRPKVACNLPSLVYEYKLSLHSQWQSIVKYVPSKHECFEEALTVDGLIPYVNYSVSVWGKPTGADGDIYWSDPTTQTLRTLPDVPPYSVTMAPGSYSVSDCEQYMCVVLYWKNPDERYWYGEIVGYEVMIKSASTMSPSSTMIRPRSLVSNIQHERDVVKDRNGLHDYLRLNTSSLLKSDRYSLTVSLLNTEGKSINGTKVSIPNWQTGQNMQVSWVSVEMLSTADRISWEIDARLCARIMSVTVYWCQGPPGNTTFIQCKGNFDWHTFSVDNGCNETVQQISHNVTNTEDYKYGVSIATDETNGGIQWEKFRFKNSKYVPERPLFSLDPEKTSIKVTIMYNPYYVSDGGRPVTYHISYREKDDEPMDCRNDDTKIDTMAANFSYPYYTIDGLEFGTQYDVCVWSSNNVGNSEIPEPKRIETKKEESLVWIIVVSIVVSFVVGFLIFVFLRCRARRRRVIRENTTVKLPSMDPIGMDIIGKDDGKQSCVEQDSGKGDSPLTSVSNGFLDQGGSTEEVVDVAPGDVGDTDNLSLLGNQVSPVLPGYARTRYLNGQVELDDSNSLLEWQDMDSVGFENSGIDTVNVEDNVDGDRNKSTSVDSEYVDHDFPAVKSTPHASKINSVSPLVCPAMASNTQEYIPHSRMDTGGHSNKTSVPPMPITNINDAYVDESKNPIAKQQSYENPIFSNRPEHFYYDIDEELDQVKSNDAVDRSAKSDIPESNPAGTDQINKSTDNISVPLLDSYTVAYPATTGSTEDVSTVTGDDEGRSNPTDDNHDIYIDENNEIMQQNQKAELDNINGSSVITETNLNIGASIDESFVNDDESSDKNSDSKYRTGSNHNSSANIFGQSSNDFIAMYKDPDLASLGAGSTISDVSEVGSIRSDNFENRSFSREMSPEIQLSKTAICQDIQTLVDPKNIAEVQVNLENKNKVQLRDDSSDKNSDSEYSTGSNGNSSANLFGISSKDHTMYKNPDSFSLGAGSTISDVSDVGSISSDHFENGSFSRGMSPEKSAIFQDIQNLVDDCTAGDRSDTSSGETRLGSLDCYLKAGFASPNHPGPDATPTSDDHKVVQDNVHLKNEYTHF